MAEVSGSGERIILEEKIDENYEPPQDGNNAVVCAQLAHPHPLTIDPSANPIIDWRSRSCRSINQPSLHSPIPAGCSARPPESALYEDSGLFSPSLIRPWSCACTEILEYAKWLGMDEDEDKHLFWIAREALKCPLPENWKPCKTQASLTEH